MQPERSIKRQWHRESRFSPPYCPRINCNNHRRETARAGFAVRHGSNRLVRFPYRAQRFRCTDCDKTFTHSFFQLHYRDKKWGHNEFIFFLHKEGASKRSISRAISHSEKLVRIRIRKMARSSLLFHAQKIENLKIREPIVYDGLENFSYSQFDPNNLNHAIGKRTHFTYDFNFCPLNRKGRMSNRQSRKKRELELKHGPYPKDSVRTSTKRIFERLLDRSHETLTIYSDKHAQYRRIVELDLRERKIVHFTISSKLARNYRNPLFPVNHVDLQSRHNLAAFKRETIAFSKHAIAMQDCFLLHIIYRNYMRPKFWGTQRSDPLSSKRSPAMELNLTNKILSFKEFFQERILPSHVNLHEDWRNLYYRIDPTSRRTIAVLS